MLAACGGGGSSDEPTSPSDLAVAPKVDMVSVTPAELRPGESVNAYLPSGGVLEVHAAEAIQVDIAPGAASVTGRRVATRESTAITR